MMVLRGDHGQASAEERLGAPDVPLAVGQLATAQQLSERVGELVDVLLEYSDPPKTGKRLFGAARLSVQCHLRPHANDRRRRQQTGRTRSLSATTCTCSWRPPTGPAKPIENTPAPSPKRAIIFDKAHQLKPALEAYRRFLAIRDGNPDQEFQARHRARITQHELERR